MKLLCTENTDFHNEHTKAEPMKVYQMSTSRLRHTTYQESRAKPTQASSRAVTPKTVSKYSYAPQAIGTTPSSHKKQAQVSAPVRAFKVIKSEAYN